VPEQTRQRQSKWQGKGAVTLLLVCEIGLFFSSSALWETKVEMHFNYTQLPSMSA
jgi:hypothetical protein